MKKYNWKIFKKCPECGAEKGKPCRDDDDLVQEFICKARKKQNEFKDEPEIIETNTVRTKVKKKVSCEFCQKQYNQRTENPRIHCCNSALCRSKAGRIRFGYHMRNCMTCDRQFFTKKGKKFCCEKCKKKFAKPKTPIQLRLI